MLAFIVLRQMSKLRKVKKVRRLDLECCRICLNRESLQPIFGDEDDEETSKNLFTITGLQVHKNDGLPQKICKNCKKIVEASIKLRYTSKTAEDTLLAMGFTRKSTNKQKNYINAIKNSEWPENDDFLNDSHSIDEDISNTDPVKSVTRNICSMKNRTAVLDYNKGNNIISNELYQYLLSNAQDNKDHDKIKTVYHVLNRLQNYKHVSLKCVICQKVMKTRSTLRGHMKWHLGINTFICEACGKRCPTRFSLTQHMRGKHGTERRDACAYCSYRAINREQLKIHERRHTGEKPYVCAHCGNAFHRRANLVQHLAVHLPDKTVQCDICPSKFKSVKFLRIHKNKAHRLPQYTYVCNICSNTFTKPNNVRNHQVRIHGVPREQQTPVIRIKIRRQADSTLNAG